MMDSRTAPETEPQTDALIKQAQQGDTQAQEALFRRHSAAVYRLCLGLLGDAEDAEEVLQDTFVYGLRNLRHYDPARAPLQTWLFTIAVSRCRNKRRRKWLPQAPLSAANTIGSSDSRRPVEAVLAARGVRRELWEGLQQTPYKQREALVLRFFGGLAYKEIGVVQGCNPKTAESRVRLALKSLRATLAQMELDTELAWTEDPAW